MGSRDSRGGEEATGAGETHRDALVPTSQLRNQLEKTKRAFVTRRVDLAAASHLALDKIPQAGDLLLARVLEVGAVARLDNTEGRRAQLYAGDEILIAYGNRDASAEMEAVIPRRTTRCELVAQGGVAARIVSAHGPARHKTQIEPIGIVCDASGAALNLSGFALKPLRIAAEGNIVAIVGASSVAGGPNLVAKLIHGLSESGARVGACRLTGAASSDGLCALRDAGAVCAVDFTDMGYSVTYGMDPDALARAAGDMIAYVQDQGVDVVVAKFADGLLQRETALLLGATSRVARRLDTVFLAAADAMGAVAGARWLAGQGLPLRAISGAVTASPLAMQEAAAESGCEVVPVRGFAAPGEAVRLCFGNARSGEEELPNGAAKPARVNVRPGLAADSAPAGKVAFFETPGEPTRSFCLYRPKTAAPGAPLVVSVHGISRGVSANVFRFIAEANRYGLCIVAPYFTQEKYGQYQQLVDQRTGVRSDLALLDIIDAAALLTGADKKRLLMFGYSGGAQFTQRFALAYPELAASVSLAAAGWYTMPDPHAAYPYGLDAAPIELKLDAAVSVPQHVFVGDSDVARDASLRRSRDLDLAQGRNRVERATAYVNAMRAAAEARGGRAPSLELLTGVGHDFVESVEQADLARRVFAHFATDAGLSPVPPT